MKINLDIKLDVKDLYYFNLKQAYKGMQGFLSILLPLLALGYAYFSYGQVGIGYTLMYLGLAVLFFVYVPVSLYLRAKKVMSNPDNAIVKTLSYEFREDAIRVSVEEEQVEFLWDNIYRLVSNKDYIFIYTNRINAYILPMTQVGDAYGDLSKLAKDKLPKYRIKMK